MRSRGTPRSGQASPRRTRTSRPAGRAPSTISSPSSTFKTFDSRPSTLNRIEKGRRLARDIAKLPRDDQRRVAVALVKLEDNPWPANLDVCALNGRSPWIRVRVGDYRILLRPLIDDELVTLGIELPQVGFLVSRVVDKQYVDRAIRKLAS